MSDQAVFVKDGTPYGCGAVCFHTCNNLMINTMWVLTHWRVYWRCFKTDSNLSISTDWTVLIQSLKSLKEQLNSSGPTGVQLSVRDVEVYFRMCQNSVTGVWKSSRTELLLSLNRTSIGYTLLHICGCHRLILLVEAPFKITEKVYIHYQLKGQVTSKWQNVYFFSYL